MSIDLIIVFNIFITGILHSFARKKLGTLASVLAITYLLLFYLVLGQMISQMPELYIKSNFYRFNF